MRLGFRFETSLIFDIRSVILLKLPCENEIQIDNTLAQVKIHT